MNHRQSTGIGGVFALSILVSGCSASDEPPQVSTVGPTDAATGLPSASVNGSAEIEANYNEAAQEIDDLLQEDARDPIDTVSVKVPGSDEPMLVDILSLRTTDLSIVLHLQIRPEGDSPLDLSAVDGGLSGELGDNNRTIADIALLDEGSENQILPTVYRPDVGTEDPFQRCMCSYLPSVLPPEGVRLTAHYVRPEDGFSSVNVGIPGAEDSAAIGVG